MEIDTAAAAGVGAVWGRGKGLSGIYLWMIETGCVTAGEEAGAQKLAGDTTAGEEAGARRLAAVDRRGGEMTTKITAENTTDDHKGDGAEVETRGLGLKSGDEAGVGAGQGITKGTERPRKRLKPRWKKSCFDVSMMMWVLVLVHQAFCSFLLIR